MILIADSGATKTDWALVDAKGGKRAFFRTSGYNPNYTEMDVIASDISSRLFSPDSFCGGDADLPALADLPSLAGFGSDAAAPAFRAVSELRFYGSGASADRAREMSGMFRRLFPNAGQLSVDTDTLGACRALLGDGRGFVAILGTGMNSCIYDGSRHPFILSHTPSLGFILGDEGSAAHIGKLLISDYLRGAMDPDASAVIRSATGLDEGEVIKRTYRSPHPNRFCASLSAIVSDHFEESRYFHELVERSFAAFFDKVVSRYEGIEGLSFNCVGSVASRFRDILLPMAASRGLVPGTVLRSPIEGLADYHSRV